jgi:predicted unusual protein kinase regulating ubiquinone biosynthesis (AarF/ABC1/UbiB family)
MDKLLWIVALIAAVVLLVGLTSRTVRRFVYTCFVIGRALLAIRLDKFRGRPNAGPVRLREAFESLGPTYVKLAQLVASSEGMFPDEYCLEFQKCLDRVPPFSIADVRQTLQEDFGRSPEEIFSELEEKPLASASIAQVHGAVLRDGTPVVIKVQRPRLEGVVAADLRVLRIFARIMARLPQGDMASPVGVVEDFAANLAEELDFRNEAKNLDQFNAIMAEHAFTMVAAPVPNHEFSSVRVLVMERFYGVRIDDKAALTQFEDQLEDKLIGGMRAWFRCLLVHGFFHGDVHAGNLMVLNDGRIGFLDFGIVGRFSGTRQQLVSDFLLSTAMRDFKKLARAMLDMAGAKNVDEAGLAADLERQVAPLLDPTKPAKYADMIPAITRSGLRYRVAMPRDFVLILKQMIYFDRYAKLLAPKLNIFADPRIIKNLMEDLMLAQAAKAKIQAA